jgi:hypothetical protein
MEAMFSHVLATITSIWARGALFLSCLATLCLIVFLTLAALAYWQISDASALFASYGTLLFLLFLVFTVLAAFKAYSERPKPILSLLPNVHSYCVQSLQTDGNIRTHLALRFQATNLADETIVLSALRLRRPYIRRSALLYTQLRPPRIIVEPRSIITDCVASLALNCRLGRVGNTKRVVVALQDHVGRWHKLVFPHLEVREAAT